MSELMEVGQLRPGMVVELPPEIGKTPGDVGVFMGAEVKAGMVYPSLQIMEGTYLARVAPRAVKPETKWTLRTKSKLLEEIREAIRSGRQTVPQRNIISGSDPEIFVVDGQGKVIPAWKFLPSKSGTGGYSPFWDGFQAEFCPVAMQCLQQHMDSMRTHLSELLRIAKNYDRSAKLSPLNTVEIPDEVMKASSDEEVRFRCTPSLNVYRDPGEPQPDPREYKFRFAGGHLHAGFGTKRFTTPVVAEIIKALDGILGLAGVSLAADFDTSERRKMYGRAGEFRLPKHGIEYRVLSNFWLGHPAISHLVFEVFRGAIKFAETGLYSVCYDRPSDEEIREIINSCDVKRARKILKANEVCLTAILKEKFSPGREYLGGRFMGEHVLPMAVKTIIEGLDVAIKDPMNIHKNWHLDDGVSWGSLCSSKGASWASVV